MFDTMTMTKIVAGVCGTLLVFLLGNWAAESLYHVGSDSHGDGHGEVTQAYAVDTGTDEAHADEEMADVAVDFNVVLASADVTKGEKLFKACKSCHTTEEGKNKTGPSLHGVVGRKVDAVDGFAYSGNLEKVVDVWTADNLNHFLENPRGFAPGTKMSYKGMKDIEDRASLILWLDTLDGVQTIDVSAMATTDATAEETSDTAMDAPAEGTTDVPVEEAASGGDIAALVAAADIAEGEKLFKKCKACHAVEPGKNRTGPSLYGVVGRAVGSVEGFKYSGSLVAVAQSWDAEELNGFLENPKTFAPGTKMKYKGLKNIEDRANLIAWLDSLDG